MPSGTLVLRALYLQPLCRKVLAFALCFLALILIAVPKAAAQSCSITPAFQAVKAGDCVQFTANGCSDWSLNGVGTLDQTGRYCAPPTVFVQNYSKGSQILPNNFGANAYIGNLPVHPNTWWLTRVATGGAQGTQHDIKLGGGPRYNKGFYTNLCDQNTPLQMMHSVFPWGPYQDVPFPEVLPPDVQQQGGYNLYVYGARLNGTNPDRHRFCVNKDSGIDYEEYSTYTDSHNPVVHPGHVTTLEFDTNVIRQLRTGMAIQLNHVTGPCQAMQYNQTAGSSFALTITSQQPATNGYAYHIVGTIPYDSSACTDGNFAATTFATGGSNCDVCNVGSMMAWPNYDNSIYGGTDAAGSSLVATSIDPNQWYHNVVDNVVDPTTGRVDAVNHLLRTTIVNPALSPRNQGIAVIGDRVTYQHPFMYVACTAGNPTVCSAGTNLASNGFNACEDNPWTSLETYCPHFHVHFQGVVGGQWTSLNNNVNLTNEYAATIYNDTYHFTIPVDSTGWGVGDFTNAKIAFGWLPYGQVMRLKSSFNVEGFCSGDVTTDCPFMKALLRTLQDYGVAAFDGASSFNDDWGVGILTNEFEPTQIVSAAKDIATWDFLEQYMELVDTSGLMANMGPDKLNLLNNQQGATSFRRTQVCVNQGTVCADANLVGTAVGFAHERLPLIQAGKSWKEPVVVTGNVNTGYTCSFETPVAGANITADGTITAPSTVTAEIPYKEKCVAAVDPGVAAYASGYFVPSSPDGHLRLHLGGENLSYTDTHGKVWWEQTSRLKNAGQGQVFESPLGCDYCPLYGSQILNPQPGWTGYPDGAGFYGMSVSARNDTAMRYAVGGGPATVTLYGEAGLGVSQAGWNVFDVEINGQVVDSIDGFLAAGGQFRGYTRSYNVTVPSNGLLSVVLRDRFDTTVDPYGMSISAIEIAGGGGGNPLQFSPPAQLPGGLVGTRYLYQFVASGGAPPYTFALTQGALPPGIGLGFTGALSGTPTQAGSYNFTIQACDSTPGQRQCLSAATGVTITQLVQPLQILTTSLPAGTRGVLYDVFLQGQGGVPPYKWSSLTLLPVGVQLTAAGELKGTPLTSGTFTVNAKLADSAGTTPATAKLTLTISGP